VNTAYLKYYLQPQFSTVTVMVVGQGTISTSSFFLVWFSGACTAKQQASCLDRATRSRSSFMELYRFLRTEGQHEGAAGRREVGHDIGTIWIV
jgi:hypothetical protein